MKKLFCALLSAVTAVALLCAFTPLEQENSAGLTTQSYETAAGIQTITISDKYADVTIQSADVDHIIAEYSYSSAYGAAFSAGEPLYNFTVSGDALTIQKSKDPSADFPLLQGSNTDRSCALTVKLPRRAFATVSADTTNGSITVNELSAQTVSLNTQNGSIIFTGGSLGNVTATAVNGRVESNNSAFQTLNASARNGKVSLANVSALSITADAQNGSIKLDTVSSPAYHCTVTNSSIVGTLVGRAADYAFDLTPGNGRVTVTDDSDGSFSLRSSGPVQQGQGAAQSFTAKASNGSVNLEFLG